MTAADPGDDARSPGHAALHAAVDAHGEDLAAALEHTDDVAALLETVILTVAAAEDDEIERLTDSLASLVTAADALSTEETAALAAAVGDNADDVTAALDRLLELERDGHLEDLVALAAALSRLDLDDDAVPGASRLAAAIGTAERDARPVGLLGTLRALRTRDARWGLGYLVAALRAHGRSRREER